MNREVSRRSRRVGVFANYVGLLLLLLFFYVGQRHGWSSPVIAGEIASLAVTIATFIYVHVRTRLWKLVHTNIRKLDEREIQITHGSLRHSYAIFTVTCLSILLYIAIAGTRGCGYLGTLLPACLIYFAHTLPSSILAWKEQRI